MTVVDLYTIQIIHDGSGVEWILPGRTVEGFIAESEENLTDLLPAGYRARIRRWNQPDNEGNDDE